MGTKTHKTPLGTKPRNMRAGKNEFAHEVLTLAEAANWLRVTKKALEADAIAGRVPARVIAGQWRFSKHAILVWLSEPATRAEQTHPQASSKQRMLAVAGLWASDSSADEIVAEAYRKRKADVTGV